MLVWWCDLFTNECVSAGIFVCGNKLLATLIYQWRCPWCNGYRRRNWIRRHEFKSWMKTDCISHSTNTLGKGMNPIILPPAMGK